MRFVLWGMIPVGSALSGVIGQYAGVRAALWVGVTGMALAWIPVTASPMRHMRELPGAPAGDDDSTTTSHRR